MFPDTLPVLSSKLTQNMGKIVVSGAAGFCTVPAENHRGKWNYVPASSSCAGLLCVCRQPLSRCPASLPAPIFWHLADFFAAGTRGGTTVFEPVNNIATGSIFLSVEFQLVYCIAADTEFFTTFKYMRIFTESSLLHKRCNKVCPPNTVRRLAAKH